MHTNMKQFMCLSLALFASIAVAHPYGQPAPSYGAAPAPAPASSGYGDSSAAGSVQQISLAGLTDLVNVDAIERYLSGQAPAAHGGSSTYSHAKYISAGGSSSAGPVISTSYSAAPAPSTGNGGYAPASGYDHSAAAPILYVNEAPAAGYSAPDSYSAPASYSEPAPAPAASYSAPAPTYSAPAASYSAPAPTYSAPAASYAAPAPAPTYSAPAPASYSAPAPAPAAGYGAAPSSGYGSASAAPKYVILPATITQLHPGKTNYKTYQSPIQYSTVTLPVAAGGPVANLYVPEHAGGHGASAGYGSSSAGSSYGGSSY